jgi:hypothetical protein
VVNPQSTPPLSQRSDGRSFGPSMTLSPSLVTFFFVFPLSPDWCLPGFLWRISVCLALAWRCGYFGFNFNTRFPDSYDDGHPVFVSLWLSAPCLVFCSVDSRCCFRVLPRFQVKLSTLFLLHCASIPPLSVANPAAYSAQKLR